MTLFDIATEFYVLKDIMDNDIEFDEETGEITDNSDVIAKLFAEINMTLSDKLDNSQLYILEELAKAEALKAEAKRLTEKAKAMDNRVDRLKKLMIGAITATGEGKLKTDRFSFFTRSTESVQVADIEELPRSLVRLKKEADKNAIKKLLKEGEEVEGCSLVTNVSLGVK